MNPIDELKKGQSARWILDDVIKKNPNALKPYYKQMLIMIDKPGASAQTKRNVMRLLSLVDLTPGIKGLAFDKASQLLADHSEPIAVKVFAMTVMANIAMEETDLKNEVIIAIEEQLPFGSPAFRSRGFKLVKALKG